MMHEIGKFLAKRLSIFVKFTYTERIINSVEIFMAALQGRGAGSGWDVDGEINALVELAQVGRCPTIIDVGANNGSWSILLSKRLSDRNVSFHLFECAPYCFDDLDKNVGKMSNFHIIKKAVSEYSGRSTLYIPNVGYEAGSGLASLHSRRDTSIRHFEYSKMEVDAISIDDYAAQENLNNIDILKIDAEGHELFIIKGAMEMIKQRKINCIFFEFGSGNVNSRTYFRDFWDLISSMHYKLFRILPGGRFLQIIRYTDMCEYYRGATNYVCVRASAEES